VEEETMAYALRRFDRAATPHLEDDEEVLAGTWARTPGGFAAERAFGLAAGIANQLGEADAGAMRLPRAFEVAVTDRRLLFFARSAMTGRPSRLVTEVALGDVAVAEMTSQHRGIESARIVLRDGRSIDLEVAKLGARALVERFVACVNQQLVGERCPA
jgi:hypothetical protein